MDINLHKNDLPNGIETGNIIAIDTETMGLNVKRDRLCLVQICTQKGDTHIVDFPNRGRDAPNLKKILQNPKIEKIFHFARFDMAVLYYTFKIMPNPIFCTKIASKIARTYTDKHGLKELCREILGIEISKHQQSSDWGAQELTNAQLKYAASDVIHLHKLREKLENILTRENRSHFADAAMKFLPTRVLLDLEGWRDEDIFSH